MQITINQINHKNHSSDIFFALNIGVSFYRTLLGNENQNRIARKIASTK